MSNTGNTIARDNPIGAAWSVLAEVMDPEIPVLSVVDLGVVHNIELRDGTLQVELTPTYTGCPATDVITALVAAALAAHGLPATVCQVLSPAWHSRNISAAGHARLVRYGIAPPTDTVSCPRCNSSNVRRISEFGSTPCKAHYTCSNCLEPFDRFKCI